MVKNPFEKFVFLLAVCKGKNYIDLSISRMFKKPLKTILRGRKGSIQDASLLPDSGDGGFFVFLPV